MTTTPILGIPYIASQQSQPEITHNQAINMFQCLLSGVVQVGLNTPPGSPTDGDVYVLGSAPTGVWSGHGNKIAGSFSGSWFILPGVNSSGTPLTMGASQEGLTVYDRTTDAHWKWTGTLWILANQLPTHTVAALPSAANNVRAMIYVSDETGGAIPAFSDGTNWRRVTDRAIVA